MMRSTPCVEGCCGPMLRIISSVAKSPAGMMSTPPPRTRLITSELWKAGWTSVSAISVRHLTAVGSGHGPRRAPQAAVGGCPAPLGARDPRIEDGGAGGPETDAHVDARRGQGGCRARHRAAGRRRDPRPRDRTSGGRDVRAHAGDQRDRRRAAHEPRACAARRRRGPRRDARGGRVLGSGGRPRDREPREPVEPCRADPRGPDRRRGRARRQQLRRRAAPALSRRSRRASPSSCPAGS